MPGTFSSETTLRSRAPVSRTFGMLGTYPPTACGIATFSAALSAGLIADGHSVEVVRVAAQSGLDDPLVLGSLRGPPGVWGTGVEVLNRTDLAIVQHEYGIYEGPDGDEILDVVRGLTVPTVIVAHTVRDAPTAGQHRVLSGLCTVADAVVVMTRSGRDRLVDRFGVDPCKVSVIAHGAATPLGSLRRGTSRGRPRLLTWGLLGPGKGIEWAIDALAELRGMDPSPEYLIAGATHPKVKQRSGEDYRNMLMCRARSAGVAPFVSFDATYRDLPALTELITSADLVVLPYDSDEQVTSGVLVDAVAAGRPVVSTSFPHAAELLSSGAGIVVPQRDPAALASAIRSVLSDATLAEGMAAEARRLGAGLSWEAVAARYADLAEALFAGRPSVRS